LFNIVADVVVGQQNVSVLVMKHEKVLRENIADSFELLSAEDVDPFL